MEIGSRTPFSIKGTKIEDPVLKKASFKLAFFNAGSSIFVPLMENGVREPISIQNLF